MSLCHVGQCAGLPAPACGAEQACAPLRPSSGAGPCVVLSTESPVPVSFRGAFANRWGREWG